MDGPDLAVGPVLRERARSGHMESISLTASYDFTLRDFTAGGPGSREDRTVRHETTHAYQTLATSYGYYFQLLKQFQVSRSLQILALLRELGVDPEPPLITQITRQPTGGAWRQLHVELYTWYLAEVVLLHQEGEFDRWARMLTDNPLFGGRAFPSLFAELEGYLVQWLQPAGHRVAVAPGQPPEGDYTIDMMLRFTHPAGDTVGILESAAHLGEHWRVWPSDLDTLAQALPSSSQYGAWVAYALSTRFTDDPATFCLTYSAVADLALNAALLPHQSGFRQPGYNPSSLSPPTRMLTMLGVLARHDLRPIRVLERDYTPFVEQMCTRLDWPLPTEMARFVVPSLPEPERLDPLAKLFRLSQEFRMRVAYAFLDYDIWSIDGPTAKLFRRSFVHPVIQFDDKVLHHQDKEIPGFAVLQYALGEYLRQLMIVGNRPVVLPIRADESELAFYRELMEQHLATTVGLHDPRIRLQSAPPGVNHDH